MEQQQPERSDNAERQRAYRQRFAHKLARIEAKLDDLAALIASQGERQSEENKQCQ